ncbi:MULTISPECIES: DUF4236 domain-containing protein [Bacillus]|uniref:Uncharacterized protein n=2 Tax=Bacillus TaxID=1386 RepID=A0A0M4FR66_9BACI|nr:MULTISPECIES: DUF4236 domain-containing protein [Bacillus]ALC81910.1 hypothetical protein AM592_10055 [Bacillus gobiensis]MBP1083228.1 hypothetical protein [Bacillus capparidis]MED1097669.1 DUF4236 domain-containing protein [Bacillus capparidis]
MGLKTRKSFNITPETRFHANSKSIGVTSSLKPLRYSVHSRSHGGETAEIRSSSNCSVKTLEFHQSKEIADVKMNRERYSELEKAKLAVNKLNRIHSIHHIAEDHINWPEVRDSIPPYNKPKGEIGPLETKALAQLNKYKPKLLTRLLGRYGKKLQALKENVYRSRDIDIIEYQSWVRDIRFASKVISGDVDTYFRVIKEFAPFDDMLKYGSAFVVSAVNAKVMEIEFDVFSEKTFTQSGKLLSSEMPEDTFINLQKEYVCNSVFRIAREMFALLPLKVVYIHVVDSVVNMAADVEEKKIILSARIDKDSLNELEFDRINCFDSLSNFNCHIDFNHASGFHEVDKLFVSEPEVKSAK